ncbi:MAG: prephenate dehydrogenase/arogenate dehydrogenase family protein [Methanomassiliicoccales archaeon]|nr:prephenate dehydrogenase/arogenate dehydrogenase family protein [Methanomassiliicoccales archaeon]
MSKKIESVRRSIEGIDIEILKLISRRIDAAREIGRLKMSSSLPLRDPAVEEKVISRYVEEGTRLKIGRDAAKQIASILIRESVEAQSRIAPLNETKDVLVIGGAGKMGSWMCRYLASMGHNIRVNDVVKSREFPNANSLESSVAKSDFIVVATPISEVWKVLRQVTDLCPKGIVFDISSVKSPIVPLLKASVEKGISICSVHPMFGPETKTVFDRNIIVCECGSSDAAQSVTDLLNWGGARMIRMPVDAHDELMGIVLGLSHALNIAFFDALTKSKLDYAILEDVASTTFRRQVATSRDVSFENPELYYEIQHLNPYNERALDLLTRAVEEVKDAASSDDERKLADIMENGRRYFGGD